MLYWRRPLLIVFMTTCGISLLTNGYLTLHIFGSAAIYWSLLPLTGFLGLCAAERRWPEAQRAHDFFRSYWPWMIWLTGASAYASVNMGPAGYWFWEIAAVAALFASSWLDYRFFGHWKKFAVFRFVSLTVWAAIFAGSWLWSEIAWRLP